MMDHLDLRAVEFGSTVERDLVFSTAKLEGTVVSKEDGSPIPLAKITLKIDLAEDDRRVTRGTRTDGEGRFSFDRVEEAASAVLVAKKDGYAAKSSEPAILADEITTVWIELEKGQVIEGFVRGPSGEGIAGAHVRCCYESVIGRALQSVTADPDGHFELSAAPGSVVFGFARGYGLGWVAADDEETIVRLPTLHSRAKARLLTGTGEPINSRITNKNQRLDICLLHG